MLSAKIKTTNGMLEIAVQGETPADLWGAISKTQETFDHVACGACGCTDLRFRVREAQGYDFYEIVCTNQNCRSKLSFGQSKEDKGALFPKRKDKDGNWLPNGGWVKWERGDQDNDYHNQQSAPRQSAPPPRQQNSGSRQQSGYRQPAPPASNFPGDDDVPF